MKMKQHSLFDLYTGGKTPELAIFFNLACDNLEKYVRSIDANADVFLKTNELSPKVFTYLREYLWKGHTQNKNTDGHHATEDEKVVIKEMIWKLKGLRNFHSHIWHTNDVLKCSFMLSRFIENLHEIAVTKTAADTAKNSRLYLDQRREFPFFKQHQSEIFITPEGRLYFLSFFLNRGEMQLLLNQTKGSKQNNLPEFRFKHEVFTYYCHREGSNWDSSGIVNEEFEKLHDEKKQRILKGRQAFKIMNYLNDAPAFNNVDDLPLLFEHEGKVSVVKNAMQLLQYIAEKNLLQQLTFDIPDRKADFDVSAPKGSKERNEWKKQQEAKRREGWIDMRCNNKPWVFEISYQTLKHIVIDIMTGKMVSKRNKHGEQESKPAAVHFTEVLEECMKSRNYFYEALKKAGATAVNKNDFKIQKYFSSVFIRYEDYSDITGQVYYEPDQLRQIPILSTPRVEKKLVEWHQSFTLAKENELAKRKQLLNLIRPADAKFDASLYIGKLRNGRSKVIPMNQRPEPLVFHLAYYYREQNQKARTSDRFMEWAVKYLIDYGLVPDWYWETEKYVYEKKFGNENSETKLRKELLYTKQLPDNYRIRIIDGSITVALPKKENPQHSKDFYKFRLGERAVKYLLLQELAGENTPRKSMNGFLHTIRADVENLYKGESVELALLQDFAIPGYLKPMGADTKAVSLRQEVKKFIQNKIAWIDDRLAEAGDLTRNRMNRVIMEAYQLFDFSGTNGAKFLRKNEYEQLSICHFMLNQEPANVPSLMRDVFHIENRLPVEALGLLYSSQDLYDLYNAVLKNRKNHLQQILKDQIETDIPQKLLRPLVKQFNIKLPASLLTPMAAEERTVQRNKNRKHIPFIVHPVLVLKYYHPDTYNQGRFSSNTTPPGSRYRNLLKEYRENHFGHVLIREHYNTQKIESLLPDVLLQKLDEVAAKELVAVQRKLTGIMQTTQVKDQLLWQMAERYLKDYDHLLYEKISIQQSSGTLQLGDLFGEKVIVELRKSSVKTDRYTKDEVCSMPDIIYMRLQMHQVDDYFFRSQQDKLYSLALHFIQRRQEEMELYKHREEIINTITAWPDGSYDRPVTMGDLINERRICAGFGQGLTQYIMDFERMVLNDYCTTKIGAAHLDMDAVKNKKQEILKALVQGSGKSIYISFRRLPELMLEPMDAGLFEKIQTLRNRCQHSVVPLNGSFRKLCMPGSVIGDALHITERLGRDRAAENLYELNRENEMLGGEIEGQESV